MLDVTDGWKVHLTMRGAVPDPAGRRRWSEWTSTHPDQASAEQRLYQDSCMNGTRYLTVEGPDGTITAEYDYCTNYVRRYPRRLEDRQDLPKEMQVPQPPTITLCGSTKFKSQFERAAAELTLGGWKVFSCGLFGHADGIELTAAQKAGLDALHLRKIDDSSAIFVVNVGGYIGESTTREIRYAVQHGRTVHYLEPAGGGPALAYPVAEPNREVAPGTVSVTGDSGYLWLACFTDDPNCTGDPLMQIEAGTSWEEMLAVVAAHRCDVWTTRPPPPVEVTLRFHFEHDGKTHEIIEPGRFDLMSARRFARQALTEPGMVRAEVVERVNGPWRVLYEFTP